MYFWLVTHLEDSASTKLILKTSTEQGWRCEHIVPRRQSYLLTATEPEELLSGRPLERPDFCYIRMGSSSFIEGFALLSKLASLGIPCLNCPEKLIIQRDKAQSLMLLSKAGVNIPKTLVIGQGYQTDYIRENLAGPPWVIKLRFGAKGDGVMLVESESSLNSALDLLLNTYAQVLVQEFVSDNAGSDIRVLVVGGKALCAMKRSSGKKHEFRSNLFLGGKGESVELDEELATLAERASAAIGLEIAGVDVLGSKGSYFVCEVNSSPGLKGISEAVGRNLALEVPPLLYATLSH